MNMYSVIVNDKEYDVDISPEGIVTVVGTRGEISIRSAGTDTYSVLVGNASTHVIAKEIDGQHQVLLGNNQVNVTVETARDRLLKKYTTSSTATGSRYEIHAPMPALVVKVEVSVGDEVKDGQGLVILEAMKMENESKSHRVGRVKEVYVTKGKPVEKGELLMLLE